MKYKPSRLGVKNKKDKIWWVYVSVPKPLQSILKKDRLRRSTGTTDRKIAVFRQREKEDEMYLELDHADLVDRVDLVDLIDLVHLVQLGDNPSNSICLTNI